MLSTTAIKRRKAKTERIEEDQLTKTTKHETNNPLVSKEEASSVVSSAQILATDLDRIENAIRNVAGYHHVQAADILAELRRRIR